MSNDIIFQYTRTDAIADGILVDVSELAREAGIVYPTAVTAAVFAQYVEVPAACPWQDQAGRLFDIFTMFKCAARRSGGESLMYFTVMVQNDERPAHEVKLKAVCGPGDTTEPVITIMTPDED